MRSLLITDLHLTEKKEDWYKWEIFEWASSIISKNSIDELFILGDIFDKKDRHPSELLNKLIKNLGKFQCPIKILMGNHDYIKNEHPFLEFLGSLPNIKWIGTPTYLNFGNCKTLWLPHSRTPELDWENLVTKSLDIIFMHQSVIGSVVSNFAEMNHGLNAAYLTAKTDALIISGDIHVPQLVNGVYYIGTQYPVSFGDNYKPRAIILNDKKEITELYLETIKKLVISISSDTKELDTFKIRKNDQVKIIVNLFDSELSDWKKIKDFCIERILEKEAILTDIKIKRIEKNVQSNTKVRLEKLKTDFEIFENFCTTKKLDSFSKEIGLALLNN